MGHRDFKRSEMPGDDGEWVPKWLWEARTTQGPPCAQESTVSLASPPGKQVSVQTEAFPIKMFEGCCVETKNPTDNPIDKGPWWDREQEL